MRTGLCKYLKCPALSKVYCAIQVFIGNDFKDDDWAARALHRMGLPLASRTWEREP